MSYSGHSSGGEWESYASAEMQSVYSSSPANWANDSAGQDGFYSASNLLFLLVWPLENVLSTTIDITVPHFFIVLEQGPSFVLFSLCGQPERKNLLDLLINSQTGIPARIGGPICMSKSQRILWVSLFRADSGSEYELKA